jgi:hypothetical protein
MALSTLDPRPALIVIDPQKGILGIHPAHLVESTGRAAYEHGYHVMLAVTP